MDDLLGHSITYRVAVGRRAGQKVFSLKSVPAREDEPRADVAQYAGICYPPNRSARSGSKLPSAKRS